jgi:hypothetical protein
MLPFPVENKVIVRLLASVGISERAQAADLG